MRGTKYRLYQPDDLILSVGDHCSEQKQKPFGGLNHVSPLIFNTISGMIDDGWKGGGIGIMVHADYRSGKSSVLTVLCDIYGEEKCHRMSADELIRVERLQCLLYIVLYLSLRILAHNSA